MKKIAPQVKFDTEYIQLCRLPFDQLVRFREFINDADLFLVTDSFGTQHECAEYSRYDFWFDTRQQDREEFDYAIF
jgi:hypothetical protein